MIQNNSTSQKLSNAETEALFDANRLKLAARCENYRRDGLLLSEIAEKLNSEGITTKKGCRWTFANVRQLLLKPNPPVVKLVVPARKIIKQSGETKNSDKNLSWVKKEFPHLESWRQLGTQWVKKLEKAVGGSIAAVNKFITFLGMEKLPPEPAYLMRYNTTMPDFYQSAWGKSFSKGHIQANNKVHEFLEWVLTRPEFCAEDDDGRLQTSPAFSNPVPQLSTSGLPSPPESVRPTLPYGYIDELRNMIAEGPTFSEWKWAQGALGNTKAIIAKNKGKPLPDDDADPSNDEKISPVWYQVSPDLIDETDPDCVWRTRTRTLANKQQETIYEMWSPVRWVAILLKLQLPLRTFQVRMLDSGEGDTFKWTQGEWVLNDNHLASGTPARPRRHGIFSRPTALADGDAQVVLHINTNKTADADKIGAAKGYNVPWVVGGPTHQDPYYWLEKLRNWQSKYNPITKLTKWGDLDARHIPAKADVQLANYLDTAFLFRTPETGSSTKRKGNMPNRPDFPVTTGMLERPWFQCLQELQNRLLARKETRASGAPIRLLSSDKRNGNYPAPLFSLHSLRVSLITALAIEGKVPLVILQKIAGHSRLIMTLYYCKPGAQHSQETIQAGVVRLNELAEDSIVEWLANSEYSELIKNAIANCTESFSAAIAENTSSRNPVGWMGMVDGMCVVGGNNSERDAPGCQNGGENLGSKTAPRYAPVQGGARNCPMCRWFVTRPYYLPQLAARWNNVSYHCNDAREQLIVAEERFREVDDARAFALSQDEVFPGLKEHKVAQRALENAVQKFDELVHTLSAITRLIERCREALAEGDGTALMAVGGLSEFDYSIEEVDSELLQVSGISEASLVYPDLNPGKAALRQGQLLDAALLREGLAPVFLTLNEHEQKLVGSAFVKQLAEQMNPDNPAYGRYQVISLIDAGKTLTEQLGADITSSLNLAMGKSLPRQAVRNNVNKVLATA